MTSGTGLQPVDLICFEIDITRANNLIGEWGRIAVSIAQQCKWRPQGKCYSHCQGLAVCNLDGLTLVDAQGHPVGATRRVAQNPEA
jgi:hypothetical protein